MAERKAEKLMNDSLKGARDLNGELSQASSGLQDFTEATEHIANVYQQLNRGVQSLMSEIDKIAPKTKLSLENTLLETENAIRKRSEKLDEEQEAILARVKAKLATIAQDTDEVSYEMRRDIEDMLTNLDIKSKNSAEMRTKLDNEYKETMDTLQRSIQIVANALDKVGTSLLNVGKINNQLQISTGLARDSIQSYSSALTDQVVDLNRETGNKFNAVDSKEFMEQISMSTGIGDIETLSEISETILLASKSMNIDNSSTAKSLSKWFLRYDINSETMTGILDSVRANTAGSLATEEESIKNIQFLENVITEASLRDDGTIDEQKFAQYADEVSELTAYMQNLDPTNQLSETITGMLREIDRGEWEDNKDLLVLLQKAGYTGTEAQNLVRTGGVKELGEALTDAYVGESQRLQGTNLRTATAGAFGYDVGLIESLWASSLMNDKQKERLQAILNGDTEKYAGASEDALSMKDAIGETIQSPIEGMNNSLSSVLSKLGQFDGLTQTVLGISTVLNGILTAVTAISTWKTVAKGAAILGNMAGIGTATAGGVAAGTAAGVGTAGTAGGVAAGTAAGVGTVASGFLGAFAPMAAGLGIGIIGDKLVGKSLDAEHYEGYHQEHNDLRGDYFSQTGFSLYEDLQTAGYNPTSDTDEILDEILQENNINLDSNGDGVYDREWVFDGSHKDGLDYVPYDGYIAELHEGEAVVPAQYNPVANPELAQVARESANEASRPQSNTDSERLSALTDLNNTMIEIKEFLGEWKKSAEYQAILAESKGQYSQDNQFLAGYMM